MTLLLMRAFTSVPGTPREPSGSIMKELGTDSFLDTIKEEGIVLIDFWAEWCGPCRAFAPIFEKAAARHEGVRFAKVDTEAQPELAAALEIRSIPTLMVFRDGVLVFRQSGALPGEVLDELIDKVQGLDMIDVRRKLEETAPSR